MRIFLDTNIIMEFIGHRREYENVRRILLTVQNGDNQGFISQGCVYTLAFLIEKVLKENGVHRPKLTQTVRQMLSAVLRLLEPLGISRSDMLAAVCNEEFSDIEDSFQYQCASTNRCGILITLNIDDYKDADQSRQEILTPSEFIDRYLS